VVLSQSGSFLPRQGPVTAIGRLGAEVFFAYFLSRYQHFWPRLVLILFIPGLATGIHIIQIWDRMLVYRHWTLPATFILSLAIHVGLAYYLHKVHQIPLLE
jgi:hypothetical protein